MSIPFVPLYINGQAKPASTDAAFDVHNPYSNEVVTRAASASRQDCQDAVAAAVQAFRSWEHSLLAERRDIFLKAADLLRTERYKTKVLAAMTEEICSVEFLANFNVEIATGMLRYVAGMITELKGETFPSVKRGGHVIAQRRAQGVVLGIAPWNSPLVLSIRAMALPIICGNTVILKTSEVSPRVHYTVAELFEEAGLPHGVLNLVHMSREDAPARTAEIIAHPAVRSINFTGSDRVGRILAAEAAKYLKPCVLELGGKAPAVVLEDADIQTAARAITSSALLHSGQICMSTERVIVSRKVSEALTKAIVAEFSKFKSGGPGERIAAQFTAGSAEGIVSLLREAQAGGAKILLGNVSREGAVVQPHVVAGVKPGMRLWDRESFGPVTIIAEFDSIDEAIDLANATEYSLVGSVWTKDLNNAMDVAMRVRAGCMNVNGPTIHVEDAREHVGLGGASGYGTFSVESFTDVRMIVIHPSSPTSYP
ncbi:aldehyde dehydrogenase, partial [Wolfiporia cocos MD-104 SS10]